ncbi:MAG TPA: sodium:proton antiporter [Xanthobacteraceae bacterium]|jgi:Na+/H+ antiporter NhaD/arsenite permease-like protein|nr:sodium:proton antiporter [Xanthobacteraceae bacterium]
MSLRFIALLFAFVLLPGIAQAADLDGASLSWPWALPFVGILLTIAVGPLAFRNFWHQHYGKLAFVWATLAMAPLAALRGADTALAALAHELLGDYLGFIAILFALYVVAGGILITGNLRGTPLVNTAILVAGTAIASVVGTTGAAMILIRPLLRANAERYNNVHVVVFFIFLVGNIGGALSPLGDPPLFIGFLNGVDFSWPLKHLWMPTAFAAGYVLAVFVLVDLFYHFNDRRRAAPVSEEIPPMSLRVQGLINLLLLALIIAAVIDSALWKPGIAFDVKGTSLQLQNLMCDGVLVIAALLSLWLTPNEHREANGFSWEPILEVALLFAGIFVCAAPVLAMLDAGPNGAFDWLIALVSQGGVPHGAAYFWLTGLLSAVLDNAPTYLVFFKLAGGNSSDLMTTLAPVLTAISMGAVYMGALTYIGNAPNFMIYAIASERGVRMPSFFGYMIWSILVLGPVFAAITYLFILRH